MARERNDQDLMNYEALAQEALRGVVKAALKRAAGPGGMPGAHHFYITFRTRAAGVSIPPELADRYPDEITIVLQHQFWDLNPGDTSFSLSLKFGGQPKRLSAPYSAVTRFYDPSVQFLLQFEPAEAAPPALAAVPDAASKRPRPVAAVDSPPAGPPPTTGEPQPPPPPSGDAEGPKIVSLDQFRKK